MFFSDWDIIWPYYYATHIIEDRRDLTFVENYPAGDMDGVADSITSYVEYNIEDHPVFFTEPEQDLVNAGFKFISARFGPDRLVRIVDQN
ncbi:MAG: hypothetical protein MUO76_11015 [Anaerolineaceae bacterium]|nr:hypothetical protein [Anaerolineaceae bacterium]